MNPTRPRRPDRRDSGQTRRAAPRTLSWMVPWAGLWAALLLALPPSAAGTTPLLPDSAHAPAHGTAAQCDLAADFEDDEYDFPRLRRAITGGRPATLVALGPFSRFASASGSPKPGLQPATAPRLMMPSRLQAALAERMPRTPIRVETVTRANGTVGEIERMISSQVLPAHPALVVWYIGRADAVRGVSLYRFGESLTRGLELLASRGIEVLLVDLQYQPFAELLFSTRDYRDYVQWIAKARSVPLVPRFQMIDAIAEREVIDREATDPAVQKRNVELIQACTAYQTARVIELGARQRP